MGFGVFDNLQAELAKVQAQAQIAIAKKKAMKPPAAHIVSLGKTHPIAAHAVGAAGGTSTPLVIFVVVGVVAIVGMALAKGKIKV